ncbi:unnamed protein product, partial [Mesorhabditis belari]|uniref:Uncharacterized protein n=1 Tax=Mesorhabditis belari TaxID=2138241 RepID=A0AAF3J6A8_9BILA
MCLEKHQIPRVHLNRLNFDFETKDNTELKYNLPIEYYEKGIFVIDTDSLLNELERWYLGKRKIEYWRIDVSSERAWKHLKEWINQKGTHIKKTQLGFVVTGAVKNQANQWFVLAHTQGKSTKLTWLDVRRRRLRNNRFCLLLNKQKSISSDL